ncbi:CHC2 zinc finger domain-containing protein [Paucibacter sediminis]|uniref:CHC2 zinc finger domain-containing protein n=1 Tax=Paucibacter sediminis TaxID=3019553 RepID=A0AA95NG19_9BURK|nr:CHC2 zinc finger domain-containing protein [Paucibacter sp. S2-9]WIT11418.1 CHC2 zinc finger domain-containing protein [Paucibacter sp. S2-9]
MMGKRYERDMLPNPVAFFEGEGLTLKGPGRWKTTRCVFHGGSDSMRINTDSGAWVCMACDQKGGDVLAYVMQWHGLEFIEAAEALGATVGDGKPAQPARKTTLSPAAALKLVQAEAWLIVCTALAAADAIKDPADRERVIEAARTIQGVMLEATA